jgi:hypothetical protein
MIRTKDDVFIDVGPYVSSLMQTSLSVLFAEVEKDWPRFQWIGKGLKGKGRSATLGDLLATDRQTVNAFPNVGRKTMRELDEFLRHLDFSLSTQKMSWPTTKGGS